MFSCVALLACSGAGDRALAALRRHSHRRSRALDLRRRQHHGVRRRRLYSRFHSVHSPARSDGAGLRRGGVSARGAAAAHLPDDLPPRPLPVDSASSRIRPRRQSDRLSGCGTLGRNRALFLPTLTGWDGVDESRLESIDHGGGVPWLGDPSRASGSSERLESPHRRAGNKTASAFRCERCFGRVSIFFPRCCGRNCSCNRRSAA